MAWLYVTHSTFRLFTNPHSSFLLNLTLLENLTGQSFIWARPSKTKLPLAVDDQMKYSRVELSSVKGCKNCNTSTPSFSLNKGRSKSSRFKCIWVFKPHRSTVNKRLSATSKNGHALTTFHFTSLCMKITKKMLKLLWTDPNTNCTIKRDSVTRF